MEELFKINVTPQGEQANQFVVAQPVQTSLPSLESVSLDGPDEVVDRTLVKILSTKRPFNSDSELKFMKWLREEIEARGGKPAIKAGGNVTCTIARPDGKQSSTLFSCHTDTTHSNDRVPTQKLEYDPAFGYIFLAKSERGHSDCLGADNGAGVWLLLEMISAKVPGTYVFHRGEERGCVGANEMLAKYKDWLENFQIAVAFDRRDTYEIITHQGGERTCSDKFADALAAKLKEHGLTYEKSPNGAYTDTRVYRGVISECTNLGVGYFNNHGPDEHLDYGHLLALRDAVVKIDWDSLPADRDPTAYTVPKFKPYQPSWPPLLDMPLPAKPKKRKKGGHVTPTPPVKVEPQNDVMPDPLSEIEGVPYADVVAYVEADPSSAASLLMELGAEVAALRARVEFYRRTMQ
jgi:hypothetical protein